LEALTLDQALKQLGAALAGRLPQGSVVAILNVTAPTGTLSDYAIDELSAHITANSSLAVVDRQSIQLLQRKLQFQMSGDVSDETAQRIGQMTGAGIIISGGITQIGAEYRVSVRAIGVETARVVFQPQAVTAKPDTRLAGLLGVEYDEFTRERRISASFLNLAAGLGSYLMGDTTGGLIVTAAMGAAAGLLVWELSLTYHDPLAGIPAAAALSVAGAGIIFGIIRPLMYHKNTTTIFAANSPPSVLIVPVADNSGIKSIQLLYTRQF
jgi:TolB-like protein